MELRSTLSKLASVLAPRACSFCDGGSGVLHDERLGTLRKCPQCDGKGIETRSEAELQATVTDSLESRKPRRPSNVA